MIIKRLIVIFICFTIFYSGYVVGRRQMYSAMEETHVNVMKVLEEVDSTLSENHENMLRVLEQAAKDFDRKERELLEFIPTPDIEFTRCKDENMWCLSTDQYTVLIMQLSMSRNCEQ